MHLDPPGKSLLSEILSRHTAMPVQEVEDGVRVEVNTVYVIPPNRLLTMSGGALRLEPRPCPGP
jgi:two-component system CheB/CheR fusion protein